MYDIGSKHFVRNVIVISLSPIKMKIAPVIAALLSVLWILDGRVSAAQAQVGGIF